MFEKYDSWSDIKTKFLSNLDSNFFKLLQKKSWQPFCLDILRLNRF